jgi:DNA-binding NarL/FixJ family response regulator
MTDMQPEAIRLVLVDDHHLIRAGVRAELTGAGSPTDSTIEVVGEAASVDGRSRSSAARGPTSCCSTSISREAVAVP